MHYQGWRMKLFFSPRFRQFGKWYKIKLRHKALILVYHRVKETETDPQLLAVTSPHFEQHLDILRSDYQPISLEDLCKALKQRRIPARAVAVTFDDGYSDNLYEAKPLLERYRIPATVFVTCGFIGGTREFWWDELEEIFLRPGDLPRALNLEVNGKAYRWDLGEAAAYTEKEFRLASAWNVSETTGSNPRQTLYRALSAIIRSLPAPAERDLVLTNLRSWAGKDAQSAKGRVLSPDELLTLAEGGLVEVGSHTMTHPILASVSREIQQSEIENSKTTLEEILGRPVRSFAYPFGSKSDYTALSASIVRNCGFTCACSNYRDLVWRYSDSFQLPRFIVRDWEGERFARQLSEWFDG
jgi:peptidoglycan/xylan/chitin deacetylase (PgdA/CDA1 family)